MNIRRANGENGDLQNNASVVNRCLICLDADSADAGLFDDLDTLFINAYALYSTHSHTPERPRVRLVIPLARAVTPDEYAAVSRRIADDLTLKSRKGYIPRTIPNRERLKHKVQEIEDSIREIPKNVSKELVVQRIHLINSQIRGLVNYYSAATWVSVAMKRYAQRLQKTAKRLLKKYRARWKPAKQTSTLPSVHSQYNAKIVAIPYRDLWVGITCLAFCKWEKTLYHNQKETPYTAQGRQLYFERTKKKRQNARMDELSTGPSETIFTGQIDPKNNFEYYMNRAYALNRDKLKCRVCGKWLIDRYPCAHRINPKLPLKDINRVNNLVSLDSECYSLVNNPTADTSHMEAKARKKIEDFRKRLRSVKMA